MSECGSERDEASEDKSALSTKKQVCPLDTTANISDIQRKGERERGKKGKQRTQIIC
jgi:hypothetical protein